MRMIAIHQATAFILRPISLLDLLVSLPLRNPQRSSLHRPTQPSSVVGDTSNSFCIDPTHIAPLSQPTSQI